MLGGLSDRILLGREDYHDSVESIRVLFRIRAQPQPQQPSIPVLVLEQVQDNHVRPRTPRTTLLSPNPDESYKFQIKSHPTPVVPLSLRTTVTPWPWRIVVAVGNHFRTTKPLSNTKRIPMPTGTAMTATSESSEALSQHNKQTPSHHFCSAPRDTAK